MGLSSEKGKRTRRRRRKSRAGHHFGPFPATLTCSPLFRAESGNFKTCAIKKCFDVFSILESLSKHGMSVHVLYDFHVCRAIIEIVQ